MTATTANRVQKCRLTGKRVLTKRAAQREAAWWAKAWMHSAIDFQCVPDVYMAEQQYRHALLYPISGDLPVPDLADIRRSLRGKDLACWCPLDQPCHADVLLELANA